MSLPSIYKDFSGNEGDGIGAATYLIEGSSLVKGFKMRRTINLFLSFIGARVAHSITLLPITTNEFLGNKKLLPCWTYFIYWISAASRTSGFNLWTFTFLPFNSLAISSDWFKMPEYNAGFTCCIGLPASFFICASFFTIYP